METEKSRYVFAISYCYNAPLVNLIQIKIKIKEQKAIALALSLSEIYAQTNKYFFAF